MACTTGANNAGPIRRFFRSVPKAFGFKKTYNVYLFIVFAGALLGFSLAQLRYLNFSGVFCKGRNGSTIPGECYWYSKTLYRVGIILHLAGVLPAGILAVFQFVPKIRQMALMFHRINGYLIVLLVLIGNAGALIIARRAVGGGLDVQSAVGVLVILTTGGLVMAYVNIKRLQIDQHRDWMLRSFFYLGTIITTRIIMAITGSLITMIGSYYVLWSCEKIEYTLGSRNETLAKYPSCATQWEVPVAISANLGQAGVENAGAALGVGFGMALWLSILIHAVGVEFYIRLTPDESRRLRQVSYERQMEAGFRNAGNAGLTSARFGDDGPNAGTGKEDEPKRTLSRLSDGSLNF